MGARLELVCVVCAAPNSLDANFCKRCGARLMGNSEPPSAASSRAQSVQSSGVESAAVRLLAPQPDAVDGERKTVTALFADIKGSMKLMEGLIPSRRAPSSTQR
jgi:hypothetical protein